MGVSVSFRDGIVVLSCRGSFEFHEARVSLIDALERAPANAGPHKLLIDDPDSSFRPTADEAPVLAQALQDMLPLISPNVALFVDLDVKFGIGRMIGVYCEELGVNFKVFRDIEKAAHWLQHAPTPSLS